MIRARARVSCPLFAWLHIAALIGFGYLLGGFQIGYFDGQLAIRVGEQLQSAGNGIVVGVLLLYDRLDIPAQATTDQPLHKYFGALARCTPRQRPVGTDGAQGFYLGDGRTQLVLVYTGRCSVRGAVVKQPARGANLAAQLSQERANI